MAEVKIEVLDYQYIEAPELMNVNAGTVVTGWTAVSSTEASWNGTTGATGTTYFAGVSSSLQVGKKYKITLAISNYSGDGVTEVGISSTNGTSANGVGTSLRGAGNATHEALVEITAAGSLRLFGKPDVDSATLTVTVTELTDLDWDASIVGELDVTSHSDFPLALTFQIEDIQDLTSTSGDYSKTFRIPATKKNNKILQHPYIGNRIRKTPLAETKPCRILVREFYSLVGIIKFTTVGGYGDRASYYECVFYGNNLSWAKKLGDTYLNATYSDGNGLWGSSGSSLVYKRPEITATWQHANSDAASPIVYPIVSYGNYNESVDSRTIQLLENYGDVSGNDPAVFTGYYGFDNDGTSYNTPLPSSDLRPAVFVKQTLDKIFSKVGYTISSTFMDTDMFKQLVWLLPNFKYYNESERYIAYSVESDFENTVSLSQTYGGSTETADGVAKQAQTYSQNSAHGISGSDGNYYWSGEGREVLDFTPPSVDPIINITLDNGSYVNTSTNEITIGEFGYYSIILSGMEARLGAGEKGGSDYETISEMQIGFNVELKTVGHTSWNIIGQSFDNFNPFQINNNNATATNSTHGIMTEFQTLQNLDLQATYLNKGDKIRLTKAQRIGQSPGDVSQSGQQFNLCPFWRGGVSNSFSIKMATDAVYWGQTYNLHDVITPEYKQVDFIKGIAHAFNLVITTNETTRTISMEPFDTFYKPYGEAIDWTYKLDRSKEVQDTFGKVDLKKNFIFKYKTDEKDEKVKARGINYFKGIEDESPYQEILSDDFPRGDSIFENPFFAGTYSASDQDSTNTDIVLKNPYSACLWTENVSKNDWARPPKGFEFTPRLLYWKQYSPTTTLFYEFAVFQNWENDFTSLFAKDDVTGGLGGIYPQATSYNRYDADSPVLTYGNVWIKDYNPATGVYASTVAGSGLYETYYKKMFEMIKSNPRVKTAYITLKLSDIVNLDFRKLVYIDGIYYKINRILDYQPHKNQPTKVELTQWVETGSFAASAPATGNVGGGDYGVGVYSYVNGGVIATQNEFDAND